jgi:3D (Asp-Asp-Asp) domain-containing protein
MRYDYDSGFPHDQTISTTGLNAIVGNTIDITFKKSSDAAQAMNGGAGSDSWDNNFNLTHLGDPYHSGIISVTGVNAITENNIIKEYEQLWPYTGHYYNSGLNTIVGNSIDIAFLKTTEAANAMSSREGDWHDNFTKDHLEGRYFSGIISVTGLNAYSGAPYGNLVRVDFDVDQWPYSGVISTTGLNSIKGNLVDVQFESISEAAAWMHNRDGSWQPFNKNNHLGNKYHSGIISITGLNAYSGFPYGNLMRVDFDVDQWPYSGVLSTTGLNSIVGNNMDIVFKANSDAASWMDNRNGAWESFSTEQMGKKYHSGIISTTGLNAYSGAPYGNLMRVDFDVDQWPYSGVISQTGLNTIKGNLIDVQFESTSEAAQWMHNRDGSWQNFHKNNNLGNKYHSGIVSVTGLNAYSGAPYGNLIRVDFDVDQWPYSGVISQTGLNIVRGNLIDVQFTSISDAAVGMHDRKGSWYNGFNKNNHLGNKYHSGIVSITGVNAVTENLIVKEYENNWPFTGVYYNTGLNARAGNHIEIMHATNSDANFFYPNIMGGKYQSGVISVTGLNVTQTTGNLIVNHIDPSWPHRNILHTTGLNAYSGSPWGNNVRVDYGTQWPYSGIISQTGLNTIRGNLIDIAFDPDSAAATKMHSSNGAWNNAFNKYSHLGNPYNSGIISVTGLNVGDGGNRINYTIESDWPYKYNINTTGLNIVKGNEFSNALNGIAYNIEPDNDRQYDLFSLSKIKHYSSTQTITVDNSSRTTKSFLDAGAFISYCNVKRHKPNDSLKVVAEASLRLEDNCITIVIPQVADLNDTNSSAALTQKLTEIGLATSAFTPITIGGLTDAANSDYELWDPWQLEIDNSTFPLKLAVSISGNSVSLMDDDPIEFSAPDILYKSANGQNSQVNGGDLYVGRDELIYEKHRTSTALGLSRTNSFSIDFSSNSSHLGTNQGLTTSSISSNPSDSGIALSLDPTSNPYTLGASQAMTLKAIVTPSISSSTYNINGCVGIKYSLTNTKYKRQYRKHLGTATADDTDQLGKTISIGDQVYRYFTSNSYTAETRWTINNPRYLKCEPMEQAPTISFAQHPQSAEAVDGVVSFTGIAVISDYTDPLYQWQKAESGSSTYADINNANNSTLTRTSQIYPDDNGDKYRIKVTAYDGLTVAFSNTGGVGTASGPAELTTQPATITITSHPDDEVKGDDDTASFSASASANISGTTINKQWQVSTNGGSSFSDIVGATSNTLNLTGLTSSDNGNLYRCKFSASGFNEVITNSAQLYVIEITISSHPADTTSLVGTASFSVTASQTAGSPFTLYYRWERSTNGGSSFGYYDAGTDLAALNLTNLTHGNHDQDQWRVKVRLEGKGSTVEVISSAATLTVREVQLTFEPDSVNTITSAKDLLNPINSNKTLIATTGGDIDLLTQAVILNPDGRTVSYQWQKANVRTNYYSSPGTFTNIAGETNELLQVRDLDENSGYHWYRCKVDANTNDLSEVISNETRISTTSFVVKNGTIDRNIGFNTIERDGTSTLSDTLLLQFCYNVRTNFTTTEAGDNLIVEQTTVDGQDRLIMTDTASYTRGVGFNISVDANSNERAGIDVTGVFRATNFTTSEDIARLVSVHPESALKIASLGTGPEFLAGDRIQVQVTGSVNQYIARVNIPEPDSE